MGAAPALVDGRDVEQIIDNLLDNAIAYAPGRVEVSTGLAEGRAFVAVRDHGPGIAEPDFPHITERFYRGEGPRVAGLGARPRDRSRTRQAGERGCRITQPTGGGTRSRSGTRRSLNRALARRSLPSGAWSVERSP